MAAICAGCSGPIVERFLLRVSELSWHPGCVRCADCGEELSDRCYVRDEKLYCRKDFFRRFGRKCSGCNQGISPTDLIHRTKDHVFHVGCIVCSFCHRLLETGDKLILYSSSKKCETNIEASDLRLILVCGNDQCITKASTSDLDSSKANDKALSFLSQLTFGPCILQQEVRSASQVDLLDPIVGSLPSSFDDSSIEVIGKHSPTFTSPAQSDQQANYRASLISCCGTSSSTLDAQGSTKTIMKSDQDASMAHRFTHQLETGNNHPDDPFFTEDSCGSSVPGSIRRREPRTKIKTKQLEVLKAAFAATPKPNRHTREQLARDTGLNMRVIQVWFQNRRSKERRMKRLSSVHPGKKPGLYRQHKEFWRTVRGPGPHSSSTISERGNLLQGDFVILGESGISNLDPGSPVVHSATQLPSTPGELPFGDQAQILLGHPFQRSLTESGRIADTTEKDETGTLEAWLTPSSLLLYQHQGLLQQQNAPYHVENHEDLPGTSRQRHLSVIRSQSDPSNFSALESLSNQPALGIDDVFPNDETDELLNTAVFLQPGSARNYEDQEASHHQ